MTLSLALCGCGGMGRRHIRGMQKLQAVGQMPFDLVAVCDLFPQSANEAADLAQELLGRRPTVHTDLAELRGIDVLIITTSPETHTSLGMTAMELGMHVLVEKPIDVTIAQGRRLLAASARTGRKLTVAENYRRDPINRLAKALITGGALGTPYLSIQSSSGGGERVAITPWRHLRARGGIIVDMGIHYADLQEFYLGPIAQVVGMNALIDQQRADAQGQLHPSDSEDVMAGVARFQSGAILHYLLNYAGRGEGHFIRTIHGTAGSLAIPSDRTGKPLKLVQRQHGKDEPIPDAELLALVPNFALDELTAALFGGDRLSSYQLPFADIDANLLGIEQAEFVDAIVSNREPEVTGLVGLRALGLMMGFLESELLGRTVSMDELLTSDTMPYEATILVPEK
ncbi:MAG: Gfo/Idh/MocA family oxidoreductase [Caldilineaceae bacterium]|nr:Gfo/Idh/MocA family oxidoreductase [Caldilineaceae bacterium]